MKHLFRIALLLVLAVGIASCSARREAAGTAAGHSAPHRSKPAKRIVEVAELAQTYSAWTTFSAPFSLSVASPMSMSVSGRAKMVRGECIYLSMRMVGFEVAAVYVTPDSCFFADKYHKVLLAEPLVSVTARTGLTLSDMQDILMGRAFYPGKGALCDVDLPETLFSPMEQDGLTILMPRRIPGGASWFFSIDAAPALRSITVQPDDFPEFIASYGEAADTPAGSVAPFVEVAGQVAGRDIEAALEWNLGKARWDEPLGDLTQAFKGYRRVSAASLLEQLKNG